MDLTPVYSALQKADAAGDTAGAKQLADYLRTQTPSQTPNPQPTADAMAQATQQAQQQRQQQDIVRVQAAPNAGPGQTPYTPQYPTNPKDAREQYGATDDEEDHFIYTPQQIEAAKAGVNIDKANQVSTWRANFAATKDARDKQVVQQIQKTVGPNTPTRTGADSKSGDVEYFDKDTGRWAMAGDSPGGTAVNAIAGTGEALGGIGGGIGGEALGGPVGMVLGGAAGAGVGRGAGQALTNKLGDVLGVNANIDPRDKPNAAAEGVGSFAVNLAGGTLVAGLPAGMRMAFKGQDIATSTAARSILSSYATNKGLVDQIDQVLAQTGKTDAEGAPLKFQLSVPRTAAIPNSDGFSNPSAQRLVNKEPVLNQFEPTADREAARRANNENVLELYWQNRVENPYYLPNVSNANWQDNLKTIWNGYKDNLLGPYKQQADQAIQQATQGAKGLPQPGSITSTQGGQAVRGAIIDASKQSESVKNAAWAKYETDAGYNADGTSSNQVPITPQVTAVQTRLSTLVQNAPLKKQANQAASYMLRQPEADETGFKIADDLSPLEQHLSNLEEGTQGNTMDLAVLDRTIKDLREENLPTAAKDTSMSKANSKGLLGSLVDMRNQYMAQPGMEEAQTSLANAEAETSRHSAEFKRSFLGDFLSKSGYDSSIQDAGVINHIFTNDDPVVAKQLAGIVNGAPGANKAILDYAMARYNKSYTRTLTSGPDAESSILDVSGHARFMKEMYPQLKPFLDPVQDAQVKQLGGLAKAVKASSQKYSDAQNAWKATPPGQAGQKLDKETFVNNFFSPKSSTPDKVFPFIQGALGQDAVDTTRAGIVSELARRARDPATGRIDANALSGVYQPLKARFGQYFGQDFTDNIDRFITASRAAGTAPARTPTYKGNTALGDIVKGVVLGPLDPESRKITFLNKIRLGNYNARLESAMYNPEDLAKLVNEIEQNRPDRARLGAAAGLTADEAYKSNGR